eukprot:snap_masked-scaffold_31-processed-gene-2.41-mRNA-1 protein AED:1.00 eAED:1.00 QI:0/0/0/0/1/1/2/0/115
MKTIPAHPEFIMLNLTCLSIKGLTVIHQPKPGHYTGRHNLTQRNICIRSLEYHITQRIFFQKMASPHRQKNGRNAITSKTNFKKPKDITKNIDEETHVLHSPFAGNFTMLIVITW